MELRGIVSYPEVLEEYRKAYPDDLSAIQDLHDDLMDAMEEELVSAYLLATKERDYLLHFELMELYLNDKGRKLSDAKPIEEGELTEDLKNLLNMQKGKEPRELTPQMLAEDSVFSWKEKQPPARALRDFLDAHVPDEADEYYYADKVLEDLTDDAKWGITKGSAEFFFETLEYNGFVPDESQVQQLLNLWQNLCNGLPVWPNNGWSPNEIMGRMSNRRMFYNPYGSIMRVGRNDPCPCGSGKKYKRCHGR
ncbi:MAG: SEC-C domain-containing protein [Atopobiaceae bacterium]|nr:SEC-C domain-containing protein [Atopobiaceae bacterium]